MTVVSTVRTLVMLALVLTAQPALVEAQAENAETPAQEHDVVEVLVEARAQTQDVALPLNEAEARTHFFSGQGFFRRADYARALRAFEASFDLSGHLELKYNIGVCHERLAQLSSAIDAFQLYVAWARETGSQPLDLDALDVRIITLRRRLREEQEIALQQAAEAELELVLEDEPAPELPPPPPDRSFRLPAIIVLSTGAVALGLTAAFGGLVISENSGLADCKLNRVCTDDEVSALERYRLAADVSLGVGAVAVATGLALLVVHLRRQGASTRAMVAPSLGPSYAGLSLRLELP